MQCQWLQSLPVVNKSLLELLEGREQFSNFLELLKSSNLIEKIGANRSHTLLVPSNDAMSKNELRALMKDNKTLEEFVKRHAMIGPC